jgi:hypothetical protein
MASSIVSPHVIHPFKVGTIAVYDPSGSLRIITRKLRFFMKISSILLSKSESLNLNKDTVYLRIITSVSADSRADLSSDANL